MRERAPADWQLPIGVDRNLWDYLNSSGLARNYDATLADSLLFRTDLGFVERHCPEPGTLLDLGCGTGRALLHFARRGYRAIGVDLSREMLRVVREKCEAESLTVACLRMSIADLSALREASVDHAVCLFSTLGMVSGRAARLRACREVWRVLRPGGKLVLHVHNRWHNVWNRPGRHWLFRNLVASWLGRAEAGDCPMPSHQGVGGFTLHLFTRHEAVRLLKRAGFHVEEVEHLSWKGDGFLRFPWWMGRVRAYGYLIAARK